MSKNLSESDFYAFNDISNLNFVFRQVEQFEICPWGSYKVALVFSGSSYHWYRQTANGFWSHKPGDEPLMNFDDSDNVIADPEYADLYLFTTFIGYYIVQNWV